MPRVLRTVDGVGAGGENPHQDDWKDRRRETVCWNWNGNSSWSLFSQHPFKVRTLRGRKKVEAMQWLTVQRAEVGAKTPLPWRTAPPRASPFDFYLWVNEVDTAAWLLDDS